MPITKSVRLAHAIRNVEMSILRPDGHRLFVLVSSSPLFDAAGKVIAAMVVFEDITERKLAELALKESEERYRTLVDTSTDAIIVHQNGEFVYANPAALALLGANDFEQLRCKKIFDFILPQDKGSIKGRLEQAKAGKKVAPQEEQVKRLNGEVVPVEAIGAPIHYGGKQAIQVILRDITQRKEMTKKLSEYTTDLEKLVEKRTKEINASELQYHELYESFGEAFIAVDWEMNVIHWNRAAERVTEVKTADALGKKVYDVLPEMMSIDVTPYAEALQKKKPARFMMNTVSRETKKPSVFEISTYPSSQGIIIIVEDKTEEEQTKRLSVIGATAGMVGHDIRNPLQAIVGDLFLAKTELETMPETKQKASVLDSIQEIEHNIDYINKIVQDLQDYARPLSPRVEESDLAKIVDRIIQKETLPANITVTIDIDNEAQKLKADPYYMNRIMHNLITNSIQAMPNGGQLTILACREASDLAIAVKDTGSGIPMDIQSKVFNVMFTTKAKGQGFGLPVVKRMTEALGGTVSFESHRSGTTFTVHLPLKK